MKLKHQEVLGNRLAIRYGRREESGHQQQGGNHAETKPQLAEAPFTRASHHPPFAAGDPPRQSPAV